MTVRALLIEDNPQNRYLVVFLLEAHGFAVAEAVTGLAGIARAEREPFDIILLDVQLPEMNGYDVARALRAIPALAAVPIVAVTSYAMVGDREAAIAAGCDGYIEKPIDPVSFVQQVRTYLGARSGA